MRLTRLRKFGTDESGFSLVFVGLGGLALVGASMLAIDVGMLMSARSQAQNAADAGAMAGAIALAYDDWDDRTPAGPAVVRAKATAVANEVQGAAVVVNDADVVFLNDEAGVANRVQVTVHRDTANNNPVSTLIAQYFGIKSANVTAVATAEASPANAMTCVKPFTIPDRWIEKNPITTPWDVDKDFSRYDKKGNLLPVADVYEPQYLPGTQTANPDYSGYNSEESRGEKLVLHQEEVGDRICGFVAGYLLWARLVPYGPQAISITERLTGRQLGPLGRQLVATAEQLRDQPEPQPG